MILPVITILPIPITVMMERRMMQSLIILQRKKHSHRIMPTPGIMQAQTLMLITTGSDFDANKGVPSSRKYSFIICVCDQFLCGKQFADHTFIDCTFLTFFDLLKVFLIFCKSWSQICPDLLHFKKNIPVS